MHANYTPPYEREEHYHFVDRASMEGYTLFNSLFNVAMDKYLMTLLFTQDMNDTKVCLNAGLVMTSPCQTHVPIDAYSTVSIATTITNTLSLTLRIICAKVYAYSFILVGNHQCDTMTEIL